MSDAASTGALSSMLNADAFMKLFITQMTHQDPTNPMDPSAMLSQLADLTAVEKQTQMAASFASALRSENLNLARGLIGHQVAYDVNGEIHSGLVTSAVEQDGAVGVIIGDRFISLDNIVEISKAQP